MKLRRTTCVGLFAVAAMGVLLLDPRYTSGQPGMGGGFGKGGGGGREFGKGGGGPGGGQPGGGFGKGGGGGANPFTDPERVFNFYARGSDVIDFSRMDPNMKSFARSGFEKAGLPAPNDNTVITKAQFVDSFTKALAAKGITPGGPLPQPGSAPGNSYGGAPGGGNGMTFRMEGGGNRGPGGGPGGGWNPNGGGPGGGWNPNGGGPGGWNQGQGGNWNQGGNVSMTFNREGGNGGLEREKMGGPTNFRMTDRDIENRFNDQDANHDGKLSEDELSDRSPLKGAFKETDTSKDGYIDLQEYKAYIAARFGGEGGDQSSFGSYAGNGNYGRDGRDNRPQEQPVVAIRYGKLPTGLPSWWDTLDADKDGQIGLYEWRQDGRDIKEFQKMDLDGDGYLAPQEWQRFNVISAEQAKAIAAEEEIGGTSGGGNTKGGGQGGRGMFPGGGGGSFPGGGGGTFPGGGGKDKGGMFPGGGKGDKGGDRERPSDNSKNPFRSGGGGKKDR